jgi:5-methyltetrahydropteroyltriglutamate--homocysteine methyltransferase
MKLQTAVLGFPRMGPKRELKKATETFWKDNSFDALAKQARHIRKENWLLQKKAGIDFIPSNDFSLYDHMLDMAVLLGVIPERYGKVEGLVDTETYFAMARGKQNVTAMEMTKWFDTNYHYIVPEFKKGQSFRLASSKPFDEFKEALALGITTRPVLVGPLTFLMLGKAKDEGFNVLELLPDLLPVYTQILNELKSLGAKNVQIDEPILVMDLSADVKKAFESAYQTLSGSGTKLALTTYFGELEDNLDLALNLPVDTLHVDLTRGDSQLSQILKAPGSLTLSLGIIDGRNIWKADLSEAIKIMKDAAATRPSSKIIIASSSSLLHVPLDLELETKMDKELKGWLSFACQKLEEIHMIQKAIKAGPSVKAVLQANKKAVLSRKESKRIHQKSVADRIKTLKAEDAQRKSPFAKRQIAQRKRLRLPLYPTTTIGSFPQTKDIRQARAEFRTGKKTHKDYDAFLKQQTRDVISRQEEIGLDVLVHGEFERTDMVEYFGVMLNGFAFTQFGWVQSYGSRYVKPPIIFGDVSRSKPMTVSWFKYAQALTDRPVKGMLTGPITILQWSFVRDDQPRSQTALQIGLAIRDEVQDLEDAGSAIIQIDEPAIREGLPLRRKHWNTYLKWAVHCFKVASSSVRDETQIHTHMCYSEFNDIIEAIAALDADAISIETSRSQMELLQVFAQFHYPNEIGPGVYDIHSPRVPTKEEISELLKKASRVLPAKNIWVNPDCGLKTRDWKETTPSLKNMVETAKQLRSHHEQVSSDVKTH